jgi:hypothetical protein
MTIFKGTGLVWDREKKKRLCKFVDGKYETEDTRVIRLLKEIPTVELISEDEPAKEPKTEKTKPEIMALLDEAGTEYNPRDKKEVLLKLLEVE